MRIQQNHLNFSILRAGKKQSLTWTKFQFLASWKPAFSLNTNSWIGGYQRFFIMPIAKLWKKFVKAMTFSKIQDCRFYAFIGYDFIGLDMIGYWIIGYDFIWFYAFIGYDFIGLIFINEISIHIKLCSTLLHWIVCYSLTIIYFSKKLYIFITELTDCLCLLTKSMRYKQKLLFQSVLMIAYFDTCFQNLFFY